MIEISLLDVASINLENHPDCDQFIIKYISGTITLNRHSFEDYQLDCINRKNAYRYQLREAALLIEREAGERAKDILSKLIDAVNTNELPVYEPSKNAKYLGKTVRDYFEEAYSDDLNKWIDVNENRIAWRFPVPLGDKVGNGGVKPLQRQRFQETEILRVITELGHVATKLPRANIGKSGIKSKVRGKLNFTVGVFNKAWERLRSNNEINDE